MKHYQTIKAKWIIIGLLFFACAACDRSLMTKFKFIDYSFDDGWNDRFSLFIDSLGTYQLRINDRCYQGLLTEQAVENVEVKLMQVAGVIKQDSFISNITDQETREIIFKLGDNRRQIFCYGSGYPPILGEVFKLLENLRDTSQLSKVDKCSFPCESCGIFFIDTFSGKIKVVPPR